MTIGRVAKGSLWLYIGGLFSSFLGLLFWVLVSFFVPDSVVGSAAAVVALQGLLISIVSLGLPAGLQRFIGQSLGWKNHQQLSSYFLVSLVIILLLNLPMVVVVFIASFLNISIFNLTSFELLFVGILIIFSFWSPLFTSLFKSFLRTGVPALAQITSSVLKLLAGLSLLLLNFGWLGIMFSLLMASIISDIILLLFASRLFKEFELTVSVKLSQSSDLLKASLPSWVPNASTIVAQSVAVLFIFGYVGGAETGHFAIALAISSIVLTLPSSIQSLMFPVLSGMKSGRKEAISRTIQLSLAFTLPLASVFALYSYLPLLPFGPNYVQASNLLTILVLGALISPIVSGYTSYVYAIGKYSHVTIIGTIANVSRVVLYILLLPFFMATGIALSYTLGVLVALLVSLPSARKIGYNFNWTKYLTIIVIPSLLAIFFFVFSIHWLIGIPVIMLVSLIAYTRLRIITKKDLLEIAQAFLSEETILRVYLRTKPVIRILFGE
jgi:O-antigen/teichoic acid export membrane protein